MDTTRFLRLREIFDRVVQIPTAEREAYLDRECGGDAELRAEAQALWEAYLSPAAATPSPAAPPDPAGERLVGPYRIQGRIGEGGMGAVYLAVRDDGAFRKQVALKILRADQVFPEFIRRFHQERQVLANLDHPNIARILDGGQTPEGLPYYVMEFVEGVPLDRYCDQRKLDLAARVRLFQQLCHAVHYLHENLVVHRDLKPSNILVNEDGTVKLLDFGIAKLQIPAASDVTVPYNRLMTPAYASPEQLSGAQINRASDIYSLGVILYQILTGTLPFADPAAKLNADPPLPSRGIREDISRTPETTSQLRRRIVGDLDNIVLMCLRRDPRQRYGSAMDLAEDLQHFLEGRTVTARPGHFTERTVKFVKRNRLAVAVCTLLMLLAMFGTWQALEAQIQTRRAAAKETEIARLLDTLKRSSGQSTPASARMQDVHQFRQAMERDFPAAVTARPGATPEHQDLLRRALQYLDSLRPYAAQDPALASELAQAYQSLGRQAQPLDQEIALTAFRNAAELLAGLPAATPAPGQSPDQPRVSAGTYSNPLRRAARAAPEEPVPPPDATPQPVETVPAVDQAARDAVESRQMEVTAKAQTADGVMEQLRASSARLGQIVHPDTTAAYNRMKLMLAAAARDLANGRLDAARESLDIADALANRVLKAGGR